MEQQASQQLNGMNSDVHPRNQPAGTYRTAVNALHNGAEGQLISDEGTLSLSIKLHPDETIVGHLDVGRDEILLFITQERISSYPHKGGFYSYIALYNAKTDRLRVILADPADVFPPRDRSNSESFSSRGFLDRRLNLSSEHPVGAIYKTKGSGDRIVYWVDGFNPPRQFNIDNQNEYQINPNALSTDEGGQVALHKLLVIKQVSQYPTFEKFEVLDYGGKIRVGSYNVAVRFLDQSGNATPWCGYSHTVVVYKSSLYDDYSSIEGSSNEKRFEQILSYETSKSLLVELGNVDNQFTHYQLALVECNEGAGKVNRVSMSDSIPTYVTSFHITGDNFPFTIDEVELGNFFEVIESAQTITQLNNRLILGNITKTTIPWHNLQKYASKIKARGVVYHMKHGVMDPTSNKHPQCNYNAGFMPGEVYAFGIVYLFKNGLISPVFHIPGVEVPVNSENNKKNWDIVRDKGSITGFALDAYTLEGSVYESPRACDVLKSRWISDSRNGGYWGKDYRGVALADTPVRFHRFPTRKDLGLPIARPYEPLEDMDSLIQLSDEADGITLMMKHDNRLVIPSFFQFVNLYHQYLAAYVHSYGKYGAYTHGYSHYIYRGVSEDGCVAIKDYLNPEYKLGSARPNDEEDPCFSRINAAYLEVQKYHIRRLVLARENFMRYLLEYNLNVEDIDKEGTLLWKWAQMAQSYWFNGNTQEIVFSRSSHFYDGHNLDYDNFTQFRVIIEIEDEAGNILLTGAPSYNKPSTQEQYNPNMSYVVNTTLSCSIQADSNELGEKSYMSYRYHNGETWYHITNQTQEALGKLSSYKFKVYPMRFSLSENHKNRTASVKVGRNGDGNLIMHISKKVSVSFSKERTPQMYNGDSLKKFKVKFYEVPFTRSAGADGIIMRYNKNATESWDHIYSLTDFSKGGWFEEFLDLYESYNNSNELFYLAKIAHAGLFNVYKEIEDEGDIGENLDFFKYIVDKLKDEFKSIKNHGENLLELMLGKFQDLEIGESNEGVMNAFYKQYPIWFSEVINKNPKSRQKKLYKLYNKSILSNEGRTPLVSKKLSVAGGSCYLLEGSDVNDNIEFANCSNSLPNLSFDLDFKEANNIGVSFSNIDIPDPGELAGNEVVGYHIVRCKREQQDKTVVDTGVAFPMLRANTERLSYSAFGLPVPVIPSNMDVSNFFAGRDYYSFKNMVVSNSWMDLEQANTSLYPTQFVAFITPTLLFEPESFIPFDTVQTTGMYHVSYVDIDHFVVGDVLDGTSYNEKIHNAASQDKDKDGWDLYVQTRNVDVDLLSWVNENADLGSHPKMRPIKNRLTECSLVNVDGIANTKNLEFFILKSLESKEYKSINIFNLSSDNRIGVMILPYQVQFTGQELPYITLTKTNSSCYSDWRTRSYFPLEQNPVFFQRNSKGKLLPQSSVRIEGGGDVFISPMRFVTSSFVDNFMPKRSTTEAEDRAKIKKVVGIILGVVGVTVGVLAAVFTGGTALPLLVGIAASTVGVAASFFKSGLEVDNLTRAYTEEWGSGLRETVSDLPLNYVMRGMIPFDRESNSFKYPSSSGHVGPADDSIEWVVNSLNDLWFESPVNIDLRYSYPESGVSYLRPLVKEVPSIVDVKELWQGNEFGKDKTQKKATGILQNYALMKLTTVDLDRKVEGRIYRGCALGEIYSINPDYYRFPEQQKLFMIPDTYIHCLDSTEVFKHRIYYSDPTKLEAVADSYGIFKTNNYLDIGSTHGSVTNVFSLRDNLYITTEKALWETRAEMQERVTGDDLVVSLVGTGSFLSHQPLRIGDSQYALGGTRFKQSFTKVNGVVYYFSDTDGAIYRFDGNELTPLSRNGLEKFFRSLSLYWKSIEGEHCEVMGLHGRHMLPVYDNRNERIIFFWKDATECFSKLDLPYTPPSYSSISNQELMQLAAVFGLRFTNVMYLFSNNPDKGFAASCLYQQALKNIYSEGLNEKIDTHTEKQDKKAIIDFHSKAKRHEIAFALSYSLKTQSWISFHSYRPVYAFTTKDSFITVSLGCDEGLPIESKDLELIDTGNLGAGSARPILKAKRGKLKQQFHLHGGSRDVDSTYLWYYDRSHPYSLILSYSAEGLQNSIWESFSFKTELKDMQEMRVIDAKTFTKFAARTKNQATKMHDLRIVKPQENPTNFVEASVSEGAQMDKALAVFQREGIWRLNRLRSYPIPSGNMNSNLESIYLNLSNFTQDSPESPSWYNLEPLRGDYLEILLQYQPGGEADKYNRFTLYQDGLETSKSER